MATETSKQAYKEELASGRIETTKETVYKWFKRNPLRTDKEISLLSELDINIITARRNELVEEGRIVKAGERRNFSTGKLSIIWQASDEYMGIEPREFIVSYNQMTHVLRLIPKMNSFQKEKLRNALKLPEK